jgi:DNA repair protein RecO
MVFEGIVVGKVPFKERDLIVKLLLRNGHLASVYVFGGQGGGKKQRPAVYDLGVMMKVTVKDRRARGAEVSELMHAEESQKVWEPLHVRHDYRAFYLSCLYLELVQKFALTFHPEHEAHSDHDGVFTVLSNALYYLDDSVSKQVFLAEQQLGLFLVKLLYHLGIMPETDNCSYCGTDLFESVGVSFLIDQGNFACHSCAPTEHDEKGLLYRIKKSYQTHFRDYSSVDGANFREVDKILQYFCHHFHLRPMELKSYSVLFK